MVKLRAKIACAHAVLVRGLAVGAAAAEVGVTVAACSRAVARCRGVAPDGWAAALGDKRAGNSGRSVADRGRFDRFWAAFDSVYLSAARPTAAACFDWCCEWARGEGCAVPLRSAAYRHVAGLDPALVTLKRDGPAALEGRFPVQRRHVVGLRAAEEVSADGWPLDTFVQLPPLGDGTVRGVGRPCLWAVQDVASRKILHWQLVEAESAEAVLAGVAGVAVAHGVCIDNLRLDNTRAASAHWLSRTGLRGRQGAERLDGVLDEAGVRVRRTRLIATGGRTAGGRPAHVGWGGGKPVERVFRVLGDRVSRHPLLVDFFTGRGPGDKPFSYNHGRAGADWALVEEVVAAEVAALNALSGRRAEGLRQTGESADACWARLCEERPGRPADDEYLWALLSPAESTVVRGDGSFGLRAGAGAGFGVNRYYAPELLGYVGKRVQVRYSPAALHAAVWVTDGGRRVCQAECLVAAGFSDAAAAREHNSRRRGWTRSVAAAAKARAEVEAGLAAEVARASLARGAEVRGEGEEADIIDIRGTGTDGGGGRGAVGGRSDGGRGADGGAAERVRRRLAAADAADKVRFGGGG